MGVRLVPATACGPAGTRRSRLVAVAEQVGRLECGPRRRGRHTAADADVLHALGRQAALALANAQLAHRLRQRLDDLNTQAAELSASRARIVAAEAAEAAGRRRLERDIHDGVQQQLVSLMTGLSVARTQLPAQPEAAAATLTGMQDGFRQVVATSGSHHGGADGVGDGVLGVEPPAVVAQDFALGNASTGVRGATRY
jgi:signal transduction histidine kinase